MLGVGAVLGVLAWGALRFALVEPPEAVHHHANFALFIDGERVDLSGDRYMEDVASCSADPASLRPVDRVHLHDNRADVVHVHHAGATWGHLFTNLGFGLGADYLITDDGRRFFDGDEGLRMTFVVNGFPVPDLHNRPIESTDRVLIHLGVESPDQVMETYYPRVASNAAEYNETSDPAGCAGAHVPLSLTERLKLAFIGA